MNPRYYFPLRCVVALTLVTFQMRAADVAPSDPDLPQPLNLSVTQSLIEKSPFTRPLDLSDSLQLTGGGYVDGKPVATVVVRET